MQEKTIEGVDAAYRRMAYYRRDRAVHQHLEYLEYEEAEREKIRAYNARLRGEPVDYITGGTYVPKKDKYGRFVKSKMERLVREVEVRVINKNLRALDAHFERKRKRAARERDFRWKVRLAEAIAGKRKKWRTDEVRRRLF